MEHNPNRYFSWHEFLLVFLNTNCTNYTNKGLENEKIASLKRFVRFVFVQSPASILYFLPFGRTLIFISDNRWVSVSNNEHRWVGKMKCCIFAMWFRKSLPQISQICTDSLRCKQRYSLRLTAKTPRGVKNLWKSVRSVGKQKLREEKISWDSRDSCSRIRHCAAPTQH